MTGFKRAAVALIVSTVTVSAAQACETITFPSRDGPTITADTYIAHPPSALWADFSDSPGYWRAVEHFLARHFLP